MSTKRRRHGLVRFAKYVGIRATSICISLLIAILLLVIIANQGGKLDEMIFDEVLTSVRVSLSAENVRAQLEEMCRGVCVKELGEGATEQQLNECKMKCIDDYTRQQAKMILKGMGIDLDQPTWTRLTLHYRRVIVLDLGISMKITSYDTRSRDVKVIVAEALPRTILLFTTANIVIFFTNLSLGLMLSRRYGTIFDKVAVSLAPLSTMPGWFYGMIMVLLLGIWYPIFPSGGWISMPPPEDPFLRIIDVLWHMVLPILSWVIAYVPIGTYSYRTFFLMFSTEEFIEYARVRGVPESMLLRRYILRPILPPIITTFVLMLISSWMGALITEKVFNWPGLGTVLATALGNYPMIDAPVIVGVNTIYAYLLAISVLVLDIVYGIVDPRVRVGE